MMQMQTKSALAVLREFLHADLVQRDADQALALLQDYPWPGNIRELENTLHNAVLLNPDVELGPEHLRLTSATSAPSSSTSRTVVPYGGRPAVAGSARRTSGVAIEPNETSVEP